AAVRNCGHIGRLGEWVEHSAESGYATLLFVNDNGLNRIVAPPGGRCGVTSTNPVAFSIPLADGQIFSADMSTGAIALGKVERARRTGTAGWSENPHGSPNAHWDCHGAGSSWRSNRVGRFSGASHRRRDAEPCSTLAGRSRAQHGRRSGEYARARRQPIRPSGPWSTGPQGYFTTREGLGGF